MTDTIPNSLWVPRLLRIFAWSTVSLTMLFLVNNYLIFWKGWPGLWNFFAHHELFGISALRIPLSQDAQTLGWIQTIVTYFTYSRDHSFCSKNSQKDIK